MWDDDEVFVGEKTITLPVWPRSVRRIFQRGVQKSLIPGPHPYHTHLITLTPAVTF